MHGELGRIVWESDLNAAALAVERARRIVAVSHRRPDGDTLGAMLAFAAASEAAGKQVVRFCVDTPPDSLRFLPGAARVVTDPAVFAGADTVVVFDAGDLRFAGIDATLAAFPMHPTVVNIDHHATNERFGEVNVIATEAASTTEVVYRLVRVLGWPVGPEIATNVLAGLITDTMHFFNPATSASALALGAELQREGGDLNAVSRALRRNKTVDALVLWGRALERLKYDPARSHVSTVVREHELADLASGGDALEGLSNFLNSTLAARTVLVLHELPGGRVKGSLRTAREDVDVSEEALRLGGGGHRKAAGYSVAGRIVERENEWTVEQEQ